MFADILGTFSHSWIQRELFHETWNGSNTFAQQTHELLCVFSSVEIHLSDT